MGRFSLKAAMIGTVLLASHAYAATSPWAPESVSGPAIRLVAKADKDQSEKTSAPKPVVEAAAIEGFRSAKFGVTEKEVRDAIKRDFSQGDKDVTATTNAAERTQSLMVKVKELLPDAPGGVVSYILGAKSKKLIQINVGWGTAETGMAPLETLVGTANSLRDYFLRKGSYKGAVANQKLPDGSVLVFRGVDDKDRMVVLQLKPTAGEDGKKDAKPTGALLLSYIENPQNPDIYKIENGKF